MLLEPRPALDQQLWDRYGAIEPLGSEIYSQLAPPAEKAEQEKQRFYDSGRQYDPDLKPTEVNDAELEARENQLRAFKSNLPQDGSIISQAYRWKLNEQIANIYMLRAAADGLPRTFSRYNHFIYGNPDFALSSAVADWFREDALSRLDHNSPSVRRSAEQVLEVVPDLEGSRQLLVPQPEVFSRVREMHYRAGGYYALLLTGVELPDSGKITPEEGEPALQRVLDNLESDYRIADADGATWSVSHIDRAVKRPKTYNMPVLRFIGLGLGHEVGSHLLERQNGLRQPLRLMASGLDRAERGNEGRALIREQVTYPDFASFSRLQRWQDIMRRHIGISLAEGLTGEKMRFSEVYNVVNAIDQLWEALKKPDGPEEAQHKAHSRTWSLLARLLKGTNGQGGAYLKDKVYLEGNVACWGLAGVHPELIELGDRGKSDITNPRHINISRQLGILPIKALAEYT